MQGFVCHQFAYKPFTSNILVVAQVYYCLFHFNQFDPVLWKFMVCVGNSYTTQAISFPSRGSRPENYVQRNEIGLPHSEDSLLVWYLKFPGHRNE